MAAATGASGTALVYSGPGAGARSVVSAVDSLRRALRPSLLVDTIDPDALIEGSWARGCRLLVLPGGADLPYCHRLDGAGNGAIRAFVAGGGAYLGLCAGAYYACERVEFELGSALAVQGPRELRFFPGAAVGSVYPGFDYQSERGAVAAPVRFKNTQGEWETTRDYVNGGPAFVTGGDGGGGGIEVLATYPERSDAVAAVACQVGLGRAVLCSTHPELAPGWLALPPGGGRSDAVAVASADSDAEAYAGHSAADEAHVAALRSQLEAAAAGRWALWTALLGAAGLGDALVAGEDTAAQRPAAAPF